MNGWILRAPLLATPDLRCRTLALQASPDVPVPPSSRCIPLLQAFDAELVGCTPAASPRILSLNHDSHFHGNTLPLHCTCGENSSNKARVSWLLALPRWRTARCSTPTLRRHIIQRGQWAILCLHNRCPIGPVGRGYGAVRHETPQPIKPKANQKKPLNAFPDICQARNRCAPPSGPACPAQLGPTKSHVTTGQGPAQPSSLYQYSKTALLAIHRPGRLRDGPPPNPSTALVAVSSPLSLSAFRLTFVRLSDLLHLTDLTCALISLFNPATTLSVSRIWSKQGGGRQTGTCRARPRALSRPLPNHAVDVTGAVLCNAGPSLSGTLSNPHSVIQLAVAQPQRPRTPDEKKQPSSTSRGTSPSGTEPPCRQGSRDQLRSISANRSAGDERVDLP
ncbi:uncharacterized protein BKA78DRAFT_298690 [Phyllosticta capitalensis]|uniref:uncharacterized protein n=1 Tax=Phyllosticta capitalensis TaxID=121624 RepID=UPI00312D8BA5